jgi:hypothetical protein
MAVHGTHNAVQDDRNEKILIYVNGELFPRNEAKRFVCMTTCWSFSRST